MKPLYLSVKQNYLLPVCICAVVMLLCSQQSNAQCTPRTLPFTETFSVTPFGACGPQYGGWTEGAAVTSDAGWWVANTNYAGGASAPEAEAYGNQACGGCQETISMASPPMNTTGLSTVDLVFKHELWSTNGGGGISGSQTLTIKVETSPTGTGNWTVQHTASYQATSTSASLEVSETRTITAIPVSGATVYVRFSISGVLFRVLQWDIDDVNVIPGIPAPTITSFTPAGVCPGTSTTVVITGTNLTGATAVKFNGVNATSFTVDNATQITATSPTNATTGTITVTTSGGTATSSTPFTIYTVPVATATPASQATCSGSSAVITLSSNTGGTTYAWSRTSPPDITGGTMTPTGTGNPSGVLNNSGTSPVTVDFTITPTANGCVGNPINASITVELPLATPGTITGLDTVCSSSSNTYSITPVANATSYTWTLPATWTGTSTTTSISATAGTANGNISVTANNSCGASTAQTKPLVVKPLPAVPGTITGTASICNGSSNTYSIPVQGDATSYTWTLPGGWSGTSSTESINTTASSTSGNISVTANGTCGSSAPQTLAITVNTTATPGAINGPATFCNSDAATYSVAAVGGATSYTWTLPNGWTGTSTTESINTTAGASAGTISVIANGTCGASSAQTLTVSAGSGPATPGTITGSTTVCSGDAGNYSIATVSGATSYTWTLPNGWTGTSTTETISTTAGSSGGAISVTANNSCGSSSPQTLNVTMGGAPATPGTITGSVTVCDAGANTYSVATVNGATSYTWTLPTGWSGTSTTETINTTATISGGSVTVIANNACGSSQAQTLAVTSGSAPAMPGAISGTPGVCNTSTNTYSVAAVNGATSYTWTLPNGWSGTSTTESISAIAGPTGGSITVVANNTCGSSQAQTLAVTIETAPATPGAITGPDSICANSGGTYSVAAVSGATSYTWTLPNGWTGTSTTESISATAGSGAGSISVSATSACGTSQSVSKIVLISSTTATPGNISGPDSICNGASNSFSVVPAGGGTTYTWTLPSGWSGGSTSNSIFATAGASGGSISVSAVSACGTSSAQSKTVAVTTVPTVDYIFVSAVPVCDDGSPITLSGGTPAGGVYSGSGVTGGAFNPATNGAGTYMLTYTYSVNGCSAADSSAVTVVVCSGINEITGGFNVYPNPLSDVLTINTAAPGKITLQVYDITGRLVQQNEISSGTSSVNTSHLSKGAFVINLVQNGSTLYTQKLVKTQ